MYLTPTHSPTLNLNPMGEGIRTGRPVAFAVCVCVCVCVCVRERERVNLAREFDACDD